VEQRRFVTFLIVCVLIWSSYVGLKLWLGPPPVAHKPKAKPNAAQVKDSEDAAEVKPGDAEKPAPEPKAERAADEDKPTELITAPPTAPHKKLMLGSLDENSGYPFLVTFDTRGAAVERVELSNRRYHDIDDRSAYLGHLSLVPEVDGARVETVGSGTPAALAKGSDGSSGLKAGDLLQSVAGSAVRNQGDLNSVLSKGIRAGEAVDLVVQRDGQTLTFSTKTRRRPLEVVRPEAHQGLEDPASLLLTLHTLGTKATRISEAELPGLKALWAGDWEVAEESAEAIAFRYVLTADTLKSLGQTGSWEITKRYRLAKDSSNPTAHHLTLEIELKNTGEEAQEIGYRLDGPTGLPLEGWWYTVKLHPEMWASAGARDVVWKPEGGTHHLIGAPKLVADAQAAAKDNRPIESGLLRGGEAAPLDYIGGDTSYFAAIVLPQSREGEEPRFIKAVARPVHDLASIEKPRLKTVDTSFRVDASPETIEAGQSLIHEYQVFFGPKEPKLLDQYQLGALVEYGWPVFGWPAKILRGLLEILHYVAFGNYGIAIILLTMIVRTGMIPFSLKQAKSAAMMQHLAPEMQRIRDKYKDDMEGQSKALRELYAKHNFNPFGGCLLVFFQLPIFVGLYRCLSVDIDLRDAPLIPGIEWASNLAGPDKLFYWKDWLWLALSDETGWLGPYFNVFPIITMVLFIIQQKLFTPPATDEQTKMQQTMMTYMTIWMGFLFYKVPAGLCIYFITSSLWGICERKLLPKPKSLADSGGKQLAEKAPPRKPSDNGGGKRSGKKSKR
jgi:YidC/Oxa1 family membrane protein insertase